MFESASICYATWGRNATRQKTPSDKDCLIFSERRIFLILSELKKKLKNKKIKSARVVGDTIGRLHPHGDTSVYNTLVKLANETPFIEKQGNWGRDGLEKENPAAMRYTECMLKDNIYNIAFKYINYVDFRKTDLDEDQKEEIYIPCPVPIGLVGQNLNSEISLYRPLLPRYKFNDLINRLKWLIEN